MHTLFCKENKKNCGMENLQLTCNNAQKEVEDVTSSHANALIDQTTPTSSFACLLYPPKGNTKPMPLRRCSGKTAL